MKMFTVKSNGYTNPKATIFDIVLFVNYLVSNVNDSHVKQYLTMSHLCQVFSLMLFLKFAYFNDLALSVPGYY